MPSIPRRQTKNPANLTPMEQQIHELSQRGMNAREIASWLGGRSTSSNIQQKLKVIREKLECA